MAQAMGGRSIDEAQFLKRWLGVWVVLLSVVTLVAVTFLIFITNNLASINADLAVADEAVSGAGGDVVTLPEAVDTVNASLGGIDPNLMPIPGQADAIIASLRSIDSKLTSVDGSLKDTNPTLKTVLGQTAQIENVLIDADDPGDKLGVQNIHQRVAFLNGVGNTGSFGVNKDPLNASEGDTTNILAQLREVNKHLTNICRSGLVTTIGGARPC
ncbi:MAG TPA: hypothetical protein VMZ51_09450 [Acidimicrobiales bacterium]|nr:hypothetical protein [Acidimicrobiales bacterium]